MRFIISRLLRPYSARPGVRGRYRRHDQVRIGSIIYSVVFPVGTLCLLRRIGTLYYR